MAISDSIQKSIEDLRGDVPEPRKDLCHTDLVAIVKQLGVRTVTHIVAAKKDYPLKRIPFIFNSLDTQLVVDVLFHDMSKAVEAVKRRE